MTEIMRVRTVWVGVAGSPYYSNHYFSNLPGISADQDAANAVDAMWTSLAGNIVDDLSWATEPDIPVIEDTTGDLVDVRSSTSQTGAGLFNGELLPRQVMGLIRWNTAVIIGSRRLRGRTFVPGLGETLNTVGGVPTSTLVALFGTVGNTLIADANTELRIYSPTHNTSALVTSAQGAPEWATLRSRRD